MRVLKDRKTEWQCSQITHNPVVENKQREATAIVANDELASHFKLPLDIFAQLKTSNAEKCNTFNSFDSTTQIDIQNNEDETIKSTEPFGGTDSVQQDFNIFEELNNVNRDNFKCCRGRRKAIKKPFWIFSNAKPKVLRKKRKATDKLHDPQKNIKG